MKINSIDVGRRFSGIIRLYGKKKFKNFQSSHICIIGIGGVGSWVGESLARHGIGHITLIDMDHIAESNINRQIHALDSTLGESKVEAMKSRILDINLNCKVDCHDIFLDENNISSLISNKYDFVVDAIDQTNIKILLAEYCLNNKIPLIINGAAGGKINPDLIKVDVLGKAFGDPLLLKIRKYFNKKNKKDLKIPTVFSSQDVIKPKKIESNEPITGLNCAGYGSSANVTASFAFLTSSYILSKL
ncbi:tRNA threonylcarbamoyladenosine dehydratase [Nitrosomonadales bacterium]|nr:tRNA threonylcarbamoyladenosine dehydratase [Nitrosomonadales bacterium]